jgi:hypothetical protein
MVSMVPVSLQMVRGLVGKPSFRSMDFNTGGIPFGKFRDQFGETGAGFLKRCALVNGSSKVTQVGYAYLVAYNKSKSVHFMGRSYVGQEFIDLLLGQPLVLLLNQFEGDMGLV